ncbi:MAG: (2Fe-2S)-binding protein [Pseudomonadales bacterium]|nr:(2Fe-2S)-binding protein [Pseudomonadales bacterium]
MFKSIESRLTKLQVSITIDGKIYDVPKGQSVAAVILQLGLNSFRKTPVSGKSRGPFCMMGVCFDCLVVIDGLPDQQACMTVVRDGMNIRRQQGSAELFSLSDISQGTEE